MADNNDNWLTIAQAAARLGVSERTVYRRVEKGDLPKKTVDERTLVLVTEDQSPVSQIADKVTIARLEAERDALARDVNRLEEINQQKDKVIESLNQTLQNEQSNLMAMMANHQKLLEAQTSEPARDEPPPATAPDPPPAAPPKKWWQLWK